MKKIILFLVSIITLTSCLDEALNVQPVSETYTDKYWKTGNEVRAALNSIYADFQVNLSKNAGNYIDWYEMRSDNFVGSLTTGTPQPGAINTNQLTTSGAPADWNVWYKSISTANYAIHFVPGIQAIPEISRNNFLAEAYFLRAYCYFNLIRIWGDVPYVDKPVITLSDVTRPTQTSKQIVMDSLILKDLHLADSLVDVTQTDIYRFSPGVLYSLYTDVAMWNHDYSTALTYSQKLYNLNKYTLVSTTSSTLNWGTIFSTATTSENIWSLKWNFVNNYYNGLLSAYVYTAPPTLILSQSVKTIWIKPEWSADIRAAQTTNITYVYPTNHLTALPAQGVLKKWGAVSSTNEIPIVMYRLADIILLRAEALNKTGSYQLALDELNKIRVRAGLPKRLLAEYASEPDLTYAIESSILQERQFELIGEGRRWFDLMRTGRAMSTMNDFFDNYLKVYGVTNYIKFDPATPWQLYWPVFQDNIVENGNLKQLGNY
jgi:tetratricopeptide (TPR) repeat protein